MRRHVRPTLKKNREEMPMLETLAVAEAPRQQRAALERVRLLRKLRWSGLDKEAERLQAELARETPTGCAIVAGPAETD
jgi:hypothetical protein